MDQILSGLLTVLAMVSAVTGTPSVAQQTPNQPVVGASAHAITAGDSAVALMNIGSSDAKTPLFCGGGKDGSSKNSGKGSGKGSSNGKGGSDKGSNCGSGGGTPPPPPPPGPA